MFRNVHQEVDRVAVCQSGELRRVQVLLRQRGLCLADEGLRPLDEGDHADIEELVLQRHLQVGDGGQEAVVGQGHVVLHVHDFLFVDVYLKKHHFNTG